MLLVLGLAPAGTAAAQLPAPLERAARATVGPVEAEMRNVCYRVDDRVMLHIRRLRGVLHPTVEGAAPWFDDPRSFRIVMDTADISVSPASLSRLLNDHVFAYEGSPLGGLEVTIEEGTLRLRGKLTRGIDIPFVVDAAPSVTPDGRMRLRPRSIRVIGLSVQGLMDRFGIELERLLTLREGSGVRIEGNDFLIDPTRLVPSPRIQGRLLALDLSPGGIRQSFGPSERRPSVPPLHPTDPTVTNYMFFQGGVLRFGKLTMQEADLQIVDADPKDPFDFHLRHLNRQLVEGASLNQPDFGLLTVMPDYGDLPASARGSGPREAARPSAACASGGAWR